MPYIQEDNKADTHDGWLVVSLCRLSVMTHAAVLSCILTSGLPTITHAIIT
jgi:hypothetical protein